MVAQNLFAPGDKLVVGGTTITPEKLEVLRAEHAAIVANMSPLDKLGLSLSSLGMYVALYVLCGVFVYHHRPRIIANLRSLTTLLATVVMTVTLARLCTGELWQAEVVPIVLFGMTVTIAYSRDLATHLVGGGLPGDLRFARPGPGRVRVDGGHRVGGQSCC